MPKIQIKKLDRVVQVETGDNLMQSLLAADVPVASSCYGRGICSKCRLKVESGNENLSSESRLELDIKLRHQIPSDCRISCQCSVLGDIEISATYW